MTGSLTGQPAKSDLGADDRGLAHEQQRLAALRRYEILDTPPDGAFDRVTALAARLLGVPVAIVSLVDHERIWFKSRFGVDTEQVERTPGLCASAILHRAPYVLPDTALDPAALANPLVAGESGFRFYAAAPLVTNDGYNLGTLCVLDYQPRELTADDVENLSDLAAVIMDEMELRLSTIRTVVRSERERAQAEELATTLQASLMPPRLPHIPGLWVASAYRPAGAEAIGGDFYDVFPIGERKWGFAVGDVCGKGPRAAAATAAARYAVRADAVQESDPVEVLRRVNRGLLMEFEDDPLSLDGMARFCTLAFAVLAPDGDDWSLSVASGGHPAPRVIHADGKVSPLPATGTALGLFADAAFEGSVGRLLQGDRVVLFTDGILEARRREDAQLLGESGLDRILGACEPGGPDRVVSKLMGLFDSGELVQSDDAALVVIRIGEDRPGETRY